jgi:hypothetical protein
MPPHLPHPSQKYGPEVLSPVGGGSRGGTPPGNCAAPRKGIPWA